MRHMRVGGLLAAGLAAVVGLTAAGCGSGTSSGGHPPGASVKPTKSHIPPKLIVKGHRTLRAGQVAQIGSAGQHAIVLIKVGKPKVSRTRLSKTYGYGPAHGYYVTFPIKILNAGTASLLIDRLDFWVKAPGLGTINTNQGNAPYSGAPEQLDTTELTQGEHLSNFLTFDVNTPHGRFIYGPGHKISVAWKY